MEEQTGSPAATAENTNQRNGDEVRVHHRAQPDRHYSLQMHLNI